MPPSGPYFFVSYSRADKNQQRKIVAELRERGVNVWVDIENLIPGTPAWEREIERSIRGSAGVIVLLSPDSNNSQWVRREISFTEENDKPIFPVLIHGDEEDSIPLRLSSHQRVDLRRNFSGGLDELANALLDHLGETRVGKKPQESAKSLTIPAPQDLQRFILPAMLAIIGVLCLTAVFFVGRALTGVRIPAMRTPTLAVTDPNVTPTLTLTETATNVNYPEPTGKIVYTCGIKGDEVCIINPDGSGWHQLTDTDLASFNASLSPDGKSVVYVVSNGKASEIYELNIASRKTKQLTNLQKSVGSPEISPDNKYIIFHYRSGNNNSTLWIMDRDGTNPHEFYSSPGKDVHDATWSPDSKQILFALGKGDSNKLYITDFLQSDAKVVNDTIDTRGRSDWSIQNLIVFDQGGPFQHNVYRVDAKGDELSQISKSGMNAQGASFSPDGNWIAFTGYTNVDAQDQNSCEIFIMRIDGKDIRQLTKNSYCDYQPRWGK